MRKLLAVLAIALMLTGIALSVSADPIQVGGTFACSPIQVGGTRVAFSPIQVGGTFTITSSPIQVGGT